MNSDFNRSSEMEDIFAENSAQYLSHHQTAQPQIPQAGSLQLPEHIFQMFEQRLRWMMEEDLQPILKKAVKKSVKLEFKKLDKKMKKSGKQPKSKDFNYSKVKNKALNITIEKGLPLVIDRLLDFGSSDLSAKR